MSLKVNVVYRKTEKKDREAIAEFIEKHYSSSWECDSESMVRRLCRLYFYDYMINGSQMYTAEYRDQTVGVIAATKNGGSRVAPVYRLKRLYTLLRLKMTKEGRLNLDNLKQKKEMENELLTAQSGLKGSRILFFYVEKNYCRNGIGTELLKMLEKEEADGLYACLDQTEHADFMKKHGFRKVSQREKMMEINKRRFRETVSLWQNK